VQDKCASYCSGITYIDSVGYIAYVSIYSSRLMSKGESQDNLTDRYADSNQLDANDTVMILI